MQFFGVDAGLVFKDDLTLHIIDYCFALIASAEDPLLEFRICPADGLPVDVSVTVVPVAPVIAVQPVDVVGGVQAAVSDKDDPAVVELILDPVYDRAHMQFF